jgi:hypothetical protein
VDCACTREERPLTKEKKHHFLNFYCCVFLISFHLSQKVLAEEVRAEENQFICVRRKKEPLFLLEIETIVSELLCLVFPIHHNGRIIFPWRPAIARALRKGALIFVDRQRQRVELWWLDA